MQLIALLSSIALIACGNDGPSGDTDGEVGGHCYPNGTCNVGLSCVAGVCLPIDAPIAPPDAPIDAPIDAVADAVVCSDPIEPNDTVQTAYVTGVATSMNSRTLTGLQICPSTDRDHFAVTITVANSNLEMLIDYTTTDVQGSILNSGGTPIANASPTTSQQRRAFTPNLPVGTYYAATFWSPTQPSPRNYTLTLNVTGP